jgi:protein-tyrosine phosphatase
VDRGCLVQVTAQSFTGRFGREARQSAERLLELGLIHFVASDAHDAGDRPPVLRRAYQRVATRHSQERADLLFVQNPAAVLQNESINLRATQEPARLRKWYQFRR